MALTAAIGLMILDHRLHSLEPLRAGLTLVTYPITFLVDLPTSLVHGTGELFTTRATLQEENRVLRQEHLLLKSRLEKLSALQVENMRLRGLLKSSFKLSDRVFVGELLAVDLDPYKHEVIINKGERSGVFPGQTVLDAAGIMGQVVHVASLTSTVMLITDPSHALPVQINRNGLRTVAVGTGQTNHLELPYLPNNADVKPGDLLVTSGLGGYFPTGYPVATIKGVEQDPGRPFAVIYATPTAQLDRSREVLLVHRESTLTAEDLATSPVTDNESDELPADAP